MIKITKRKQVVERWAMIKKNPLLKELAYGTWKKNKGLFYSKGGKGIEKSTISKRKPSGYGVGCSMGNKFIYRKRSKREENEIGKPL